ncbi:hypothetical protein K435DRAFT_874078 [Dendrothele bispora CBS 962.96]|uniref:DUF2415 domain-containing protein n=1 Tax=Dendrothele bispora (strain CBS 962.96) TaxID=1314807 RepID=A0A4S8KXS3_DENBC|nr:hypothetical protein K435DRAFT_874078 [Dendrothele bispora CBS 962.96]
MARGPSLLSSTTLATSAPAQIHIGHVQLRDLIICPRERGVVNYVTRRSIVEQDITNPSSARTLVDLEFTPNTLSSLQLDGKGHTLLAAGGQEAELHLSLHSNSSSRRRTPPVWTFYDRLHASINNSVMLTSLSVAKSNESSMEPRIAISNNDCTVKFFDVPVSLRASNIQKMKDVGLVKLNAPVNHSSISPDGRTLLSVGDSSKVFLHRIYGSSRLTFSPISTPTVPSPAQFPHFYSSPSFVGSFSSAFSPDGSKYAVASQEGVVAVWDVRSTKPLKVFQTDKTRYPSASNNWGVTGTGYSNGWLSDDPYDWTRGNSKAPGWCVRNVKFGGNGCGKEIMTFTEHTSLLHVIDARTFETEEIIRVPSARHASTSTMNSNSHRSSSTANPNRRQLSSRFQVNQRVRHHVPRPYTRPPLTVPGVSATSHLSSSRRDATLLPSPPYVVLALEDTFRISARGSSGVVTTSSSTVPMHTSRQVLRNVPSRELGMGTSGVAEDVFGAFSTPAGGEDDEETGDLVVIPPLGDSEVDDDVRTLLGRHALQTRRLRDESRRLRDEIEDNEEDDERMDIDELDMEVDSVEVGVTGARSVVGPAGLESEPEWDCISSHTPSRTSSPPPGTTGVASGNRWRMWPSVEPVTQEAEEEDALLESEDDEDMGGVGGCGGTEQSTSSADDLDIAGTCFDPSGAFIYVGTTESVVEWNVRGAEKRWWLDEENDWC